LSSIEKVGLIWSNQ